MVRPRIPNREGNSNAGPSEQEFLHEHLHHGLEPVLKPQAPLLIAFDLPPWSLPVCTSGNSVRRLSQSPRHRRDSRPPTCDRGTRLLASALLCARGCIRLPTWSLAVAPVAQMDRAADFESVGREFEPPQARHPALRNSPNRALGGSPTPILPLPGEKSEKDNAVGAHETNPVHSMLAKLIGHGQQEPAVRARHGVKSLNQPLDRLTLVHLLGHLGR